MLLRLSVEGLVEVTLMDRDRNKEVHRRAGIEMKSVSRADQQVQRWFWHVDRMDEYHMARRVLMMEISIIRVRGM